MFKLFFAIALCVSCLAEGMDSPEGVAYRQWIPVSYSSKEYYFHKDMASDITKAKINAGMDDSNVSVIGITVRPGPGNSDACYSSLTAVSSKLKSSNPNCSEFNAGW